MILMRRHVKLEDKKPRQRGRDKCLTAKHLRHPPPVLADLVEGSDVIVELVGCVC